MKQLTQLFAIIFVLFIAVQNIQAQEAENPLLVVSYQKVKMTDMSKMSELFEKNFSAILNGLVDDGMIYSWGRFSHAWGDEWNLNVWYVAKDMNTFNAFWDEYMKRIGDNNEAWAEMRNYIMEHKDNIYVIQEQYPMPQR